MRKRSVHRAFNSPVENLESRVMLSTATATAQVSLQSFTGTGAAAKYTYSVALTDTGTTTVGTYWFAWVPGEDFMKSTPTSITSPTGWAARITGGSAGDGFAIQWVSGSTATDVTAGQTLTGFTFTSADNPKSLAGKSFFYKKTPVTTSFAYTGAPFSDAGDEFVTGSPAVKVPKSFLATLPTTPTENVTTVPANGDINPYGVAIVPKKFASGGTIQAGDVLVSNFNDSSNLQGTGTTIVSISPTGTQSTFFQGQAGLGLTTALGVLSRGFVLVGNVPAPDGANVQGPGSLLILDSSGHLVQTLSDPNLLDGPWDLTVQDSGATANVYVSNVLNGTVSRLALTIPKTGDDIIVKSDTEIASGYTFRTDPAALVVGPTGLAYTGGSLYVASTGDNAIYKIPAAATRKTPIALGKLIYQDSAHLRGPLALAVGGDGNLLVANGDAVNADPANLQNSELVEFTPNGQFVNEFQIESAPGGAFGLAYQATGKHGTFAAIDDITNSLDEWVF